MARGAAARRYAKALFQLAVEGNQVAELRGELEELRTLIDGNAELRHVLLQPLHPVAQRRAVLASVAESLGSSQVLRSFYSFLIDQRRLVDFRSICDEYGRLADEAEGLRQARVVSAQPLSDAQRDRLRRALATRTGAEVELALQVDPELLGGAVAQLGDLVFDGSLRTQLRQLRASLAR